MNSMLIPVTAFLVLSIIFPVSAVDIEKERAAILEIDKQWANAVSKGDDIDLIVSFWADDASVFPPGLPVVMGKDAIKKFVQQSFAQPGFSIRWETTNVVVSPDGSFAYATGKNQTTFNDPEGKQITVPGKSVAVWRKDHSGVWKCVVDIWNDDPLTPQ